MYLNHDSTVPLYIQLKEHLRMQIETGIYPVGARLPSERELAQLYNVSRMTARQALQLLAKDGFTHSRVGKGTYVRQPRIAQELRFLTSFSEDIRQRGMMPSSKVVRAALDRADEDIAEHLQLPLQAEIVVLSRVRLADDEPIALEVCYLDHRLCPGILERHDFSHESLYQVLREAYGHQLVWARQVIGARMPDDSEREALQLDGTTHVLSMIRVTYTDQNQPVEYVRSVYRGDRYQLHTMLRHANT